MDIFDKSERIKIKGLELGFSAIGIIRCHDFADYAAIVAERPSYQLFVKKPGSFYEGCFPSKYFPQGKSIICATYGYSNIEYPEELLKLAGRIYLARCYVPTAESIAGRRVAAMTEYLRSLGMEVYDNSIEFPARPAAYEAGIVDYGANNFVRTSEDGTFIVIYTWLVDAELAYDTRDGEETCPPDCRKCIDACPTHAIEAPGVLNPMRCILLNDLTIPMDPAIEDAIGERIHGCDVCQEVCPRNRQALERPKRKDLFLEAIKDKVDLERLLFLEDFDDVYYQVVIKPIMYNYIRDPAVFRRNAAVALGNSGDPSHIQALEKAVERYRGTPTGDAAQRAIEKLRA